MNIELKDHLGNVRVVVEDRLLATGTPTNITNEAEVLSYNNYYPFGMLQPGRNYSSNTYRFGFQGQEKDDEIGGSTGTHYAYKFRMYDTRIGKFFSVDPLTAKYPWNSPFAFALNDVIRFIELEGLQTPSIPSNSSRAPQYGYSSTLLRNDLPYHIRKKYSYTPPSQRIIEPTNVKYYSQYPTPGGSVYTDPFTSNGVRSINYFSLFCTEAIGGYVENKRQNLFFKSEYFNKITDINMIEDVYTEKNKIYREYKFRFINKEDENNFILEQAKWEANYENQASLVTKPEMPKVFTTENFNNYMLESAAYLLKLEIIKFELGPSPKDKILNDLNNSQDNFELKSREVGAEIKETTLGY